MTRTTAATPQFRTRRLDPRGMLARRWATALGAVDAVNSPVLLARFPAAVHVWISAWCVLLAAVIYRTWGTAHADLTDRRLLAAQTTAVLGFGTVALAAVSVDPNAARYVLAAGWLAHAPGTSSIRRTSTGSSSPRTSTGAGSPPRSNATCSCARAGGRWS